MAAVRPINSIADFLAHAIAIEHEAAERYHEFAQHMNDQAQDTAELFARLAREGFDHARDLATRTKCLRIRQLASGEYAWLDRGPPLPAAHEWLFRLMSPRDALKIAMHAEQRAKGFFGHVTKTTRDPGVKALARNFLEEEGEHIARMKRALTRLPNPVVDWEKVYEHGGPTGGGKSPGSKVNAKAAPRGAGEKAKPVAAGNRAKNTAKKTPKKRAANPKPSSPGPGRAKLAAKKKGR